MHLLIAPGSFKGTIKSIDACTSIYDGIRAALPATSIEILILADGGEGTLETFIHHFGYAVKSCSVSDPLGNLVSASLCLGEKEVAVIESAQAIGLSLVASRQRDPFRSSSYGVGQMIKYADDLGARTIMVTMGDSATMDMGIGMLHSLGAKFYTKSGVVVVPYLSNLHMITAIDTSALDSLKSRIRFVGLVDTDDYLCGELGQVRLYGRQKGLKGRDIVGVESAFLHFAEIIERHCGVNVLRVVRSTGSGGVAAALHAFLEAPLVNTLEYLSKRLELDRKITNADIAITGEGCLDNQSVLGKVPYFVASHCSGHCIGLVGRYTQAGQSDLMRACKRVSLFTLNPEIAMKEAKQALRELASSVTSLLR